MPVVTFIKVNMPKNKDDIPFVHAMRAMGVSITDTKKIIDFLRDKKSKAAHRGIVIQHAVKDLIPNLSQFPLHFVGGVEYPEIDDTASQTANETIIEYAKRGVDVVGIDVSDTEAIVSFHSVQ